MIYLFNQTEELIDVIDEASLAEFTHTVELNQFDRASFEIPVDYKPEVIKEAQFFGFQSRDRAFCLFRISEKSYDIGLTIQGIDRAESDLHSFIIEDKRPGGTAGDVLREILEGTGYQLGNVDGLTRTGKLSFYYISVRQALVKIIESYACEFKVRYTFVENKIIGRYIDLNQRFGRVTGHQFEYGSNILNVTYEESSDDVVTALIGRGKGEEKTNESGEATGGYGRRIQFKDVVWSVSKGDPVDKPAGQNYVANETARNIYGLHQNGVIKHRFGVYTNEDIKDPVELLKATYKELQRLSIPLTTFKANLLDLANAIEQDIWVGDSIGIVRDQIGIAFEARIHKLTIDKLDDNRSVVELGDYQTLQAKDRSNRQQAIKDALGGFSESLIEEAIAHEVERRDKEFDEMIRVKTLEFDNSIQLAKEKSEEFKQQITSEIDKRFQNFDNASIQEARQKAEEALKSAGASSSLAQEAKKISDQAKSEIANLRTSSQTAIEQIENFKTQYGTKLNEFKSTAEGLSTKMGAIETYISNDGQLQEELKRYARTESASQASAIREQISKDYVGKNTFQESVQGVERRLESLSLGTSGNLLKNSNVGFYNQHNKRYRLVETLQANQTYTLVTKYWNGENARGHTFFDGVDWRGLNYNQAIDAWVVQFTPRQKIPSGTEIILSSDPYNSLGNMQWATLVRGAIPLIHWQPAKGDVEEGVTQKLAEYKETVDGRFATISSQINGKANQTDFQQVRETSQLYERIIGRNENDIADKVARMALTNQLFQVEVGKATRGGRNYIRGIKEMRVASGSWDSGTFRRSGDGSIQTIDVSDSPVPGFNKAIRMVSSDPKGEIGIAQDGFEIMSGTYTMSVWVKGPAGQRVKIQTYFGPGDSTGISPEFVLKDDKWTYLTFTSERNKNGKLSIGYVYLLNGEKGSHIDVLAPQLEEGSVATSARPALEDTEEAVRSVQSQLDGSWSVQNINSAGDIISGINLGSNGQNRITGKATHITGETLIDNAVIKSAMIDKLKTANFEAGSVTTTILDAEAVTAEKLKVDQAFFNKFVANEAYLSQLFAKKAFITQVQSVTLDASKITTGILKGREIQGGSITGTSISGGTITGSSISGGTITGGTLTGHTKIQLGTYGSFDTVNGGLQINVPRVAGSKDGLGVQFIGSYGRGENVPYGLYIYKDSDFTTGNPPRSDDNFLLTVEGYIQAKGIGWLRTGTGSVGNRLTATIGLWNSSNVYLSFGGSANDIFYTYNNKAYSLWEVVNAHFSDRRLKENIIGCKHKALDYIQQFQFKEYDWKKQEDRPRSAHTKIGLIAQEVQAVDPTLVYENGDTLNLDNLRLTTMALKAIQELALENKTLTRRLENLESERRTV